VAVITDPSRDTPAVIAAYSKEVGLFDTWHFLTGTGAAVQAVWDSYQIGVDIASEAAADAAQTRPPESSDEHTQGLNLQDQHLPAGSSSGSAGATKWRTPYPFGSSTGRGISGFCLTRTQRPRRSLPMPAS
jgi:hypothetical protein